MPADYDTSQHRASIQNDHFWVTATMLGVNGFLIAAATTAKLTLPTLVWIGFLNLYALFLLAHRSASYAGKLKLPDRANDKPQKDRTAGDKLAETALNVGVVGRHIPFIVADFSGTLFYILLVVTSFVGVLSSHLW